MDFKKNKAKMKLKSSLRAKLKGRTPGSKESFKKHMSEKTATMSKDADSVMKKHAPKRERTEADLNDEEKKLLKHYKSKIQEQVLKVKRWDRNKERKKQIKLEDRFGIARRKLEEA